MINKKQTSDYAAWKNLLIIPAVALIFAAFSCNNNPASTKDSVKDQAAVKKAEQPVAVVEQMPQTKPEEEIVFAQVEQMPEFPGGEKAMMKFIQENMKYPVPAQEKGIAGTVIVSFIIDKTGKIKDAKVMKGNPALDDAALKVLSIMPAWNPGKQGGKPVSVSYTVPFKFVLN